MSASLAAFEWPRTTASNTVFKSGPLFISSKGLGWKSWKKRWFILTRTSLVFFKNDPSALPQRGGEVNLTLGGIELNNSGSVVVREDKKLLSVLFPDGRAFTLKAESTENLYEWKTALEDALTQAPSAALVIGHNGILKNDANDMIEGSFNQWRGKRPVKSLVVGRPILLALEDIDGGPSFLEKALRFLEKYGTKAEGIFRQSADVEEVDRRVQEYEQGKTEFGSAEDAHVVGDCVKHILRELPSSPVPTSCCTALLEAYKIDRKESRVNAMRSAILETFPEPNRRLLQRILKMMRTISLHATENRMTPSAVAACMAPLLLRPLLAGECELEDDFDVNGDNSAQLLAAANAANNAQAIITMLLEEYENVFCDETLHRCSASVDSRIENSGNEDSTDDENLDIKDNGYHDAENEVDLDTDDDPNRGLSRKLSESSASAGSDLYDFKAFEGDESDAVSTRDNGSAAGKAKPHADPQAQGDSSVQFNGQQALQNKSSENEIDVDSTLPDIESQRSMGEIMSSMDQRLPHSVSGARTPIEKPTSSNFNVKRSTFWGRSIAFEGDESDAVSPRDNGSASGKAKPHADPQAQGDCSVQFNDQQALHNKSSENKIDVASTSPDSESQRSMEEIMSSMDQRLPHSVSGARAPIEKPTSSNFNVKRSTFWGRSITRKTPSMESIDSSGEEELAIQRLEITKTDLQHRIAKEAKGNAVLQASLERRKQALHERRLALEQDVARLQEQLQAERDLRAALEVGLSMSSGQFPSSRGMDSKTRAELEEIALAEADVARLKQKVSELHHQLNQQRRHHYGSLSDASDRLQLVQNHNSQQKYFQPDFDTTLAFCNQERKQRTEESLLGPDLRNIKGQVLISGSSSRQPMRKQFIDAGSMGDSKMTEASTSISMDDLGTVDSPSLPSTSREAEMIDYPRHPSAASSTLVELTTRLDFFKERRSQLMEQLHNLDLNYGTASSHDLVNELPTPH